jgi:ketosteroid isomerase-like protein
MDAQFAHVWRVRDGKVAAFDEYADTLQAAVVMGRAETRPEPVLAQLAV